MNRHFSDIKNFIDQNGKLIATQQEIEPSYRAAELLCESLLGATLNVRGKKFIIRMLEIYYGSAADPSHDWYRNRFVYKTSKYIKQTEVQANKGFKFYLSSPDTEDTYTRLDIVVGDENVAISFLLRSVWDEDFNLIGAKNGSPNIVLKAMGIKPSDHGSEIKMGVGQIGDISIEDMHDKIFKEKNLQIRRGKRINITSDFEEKNNLLWNLYAE